MFLSIAKLTFLFLVVASGIVYDSNAQAADPKRIVLLIASILSTTWFFIAKPAQSQRSLSKTVWIWFAYIAWSSVTLIWGRAAGISDLAIWVGASGLFFLLHRFPIQEAQKMASLAAYLIGTLNAIWSVVQMYGLGVRTWVHGFQGNPNWLGLLLACTIPLSFEFSLKLWHKNRWIGTATLTGIAFQFFGLYISHSRVAWLAFTISSFITCVTSMKTPIRKWVLPISVVFVSGLNGVCTFTSAIATESVPTPKVYELERLEDVPSNQAFEGRWRIVKTSLSAAKHSLPFGVGLGSFGHAYLKEQGNALATLDVREASRRFINATTAHNDWVQALVESGPIALLCLLIVFINAWRASWKHWPAANSSITALAICALGDSPLRQPAIVTVLILILGSIDFSKLIDQKIHSYFPEKTSSFILWATSSFLLIFAVATWRGTRAYSYARTLAPPFYERQLQKSLRLDPRSGEHQLALGLALLDANDPTKALIHLGKAQNLFANVGTEVAIGNAYLMLHEEQHAIDAYQRALQLHPGMFRAHFNLAIALVSSGRIVEAKQPLDRAQTLKPHDPRVTQLKETILMTQEKEP